MALEVADVEELNEKLQSEKAKIREEGIRILTEYLGGIAGKSLKQLLDRQTAALNPDDPIASATWPGLLSSLCECIRKEIAGSKKRSPRSSLSRALVHLVQQTEDKDARPQSFLLRKVKTLFQHILNTLQCCPAYFTDYSTVLRILAPVVEYRIRMGKKLYGDILHVYLQKAETISVEHATENREELHRVSVTLLVLIQNPPGDFTESLREEILDSLCVLFRNLRDDGKIARKILSIANTFLMSNGLNLGSRVSKVHDSLRGFAMKTWPVVRDREMREELVTYFRLQLRLNGMDHSEGDIETLFVFVCKDLDQASTHAQHFSRDDSSKATGKLPLPFLRLASHLLRRCLLLSQVYSGGGRPGKRQKLENVVEIVKSKAAEGRGMWPALFCIFLQESKVLPPGFLQSSLQKISDNMERQFAEGQSSKSHLSPVWVIRCLREIANSWPEAASFLTHEKQEASRQAWRDAVEKVQRWIAPYSGSPAIVDEMLGFMARAKSAGVAPRLSSRLDLSGIGLISGRPTINSLLFVASFLNDIDPGQSGALVNWILKGIHLAPTKGRGNEEHSELFMAAVTTTLLAAITMSPVESLHFSSSDSHWWSELTEESELLETKILGLNRSEEVLVSCDLEGRDSEEEAKHMLGEITLARASNLGILSESGTVILSHIDQYLAMEITAETSPQAVNVCTVFGSILRHVNKQKRSIPGEWKPSGRIHRKILKLLSRVSLSISQNIDKPKQRLVAVESRTDTSSSRTFSHQNSRSSSTNLSLFTRELNSAFCTFAGSPAASFLAENSSNSEGPFQASFEAVIDSFIQIASDSYLTSPSSYEEDEFGSPESSLPHPRPIPEPHAHILDDDFDMAPVNVGAKRSDFDSIGTQASAMSSRKMVISSNLKACCLHVIGILGGLRQNSCFSALKGLLGAETEHEARAEILLQLSKSFDPSPHEGLPQLLKAIEREIVNSKWREASRALMLQVCAILTRKLQAKFGTDSRTQEALRENTVRQLVGFVNSLVSFGLHFWTTRLWLPELVASLVNLDPNIAQALIDSSFLPLFQDLEYRVRIRAAKFLNVLFEKWTGHEDLLQDIIHSCGVTLVEVNGDVTVTASQADVNESLPLSLQESTLVTIGNIASASESVEAQCVFIVCAHVVRNKALISLGSAIFDHLSHSLSYPNKLQYLELHLSSVMNWWAETGMPMSKLDNLRILFGSELDKKDWLQFCAPHILPSLFLFNRLNQVDWLAESLDYAVKDFVQGNFSPIFAALLPFHCSEEQENREKAIQIMQETLLLKSGLTDRERDELISKKMTIIVSLMLKHTSADENAKFPFFPVTVMVSAIQTLVDGFLDSQESQQGHLIDKLKVLRPDRTFVLVMELHHQVNECCHSRQRKQALSGIECLVLLLEQRATVPSIFRYLAHILLQRLSDKPTQGQCCKVLLQLLRSAKQESNENEELFLMLGNQLQAIVSKVVACLPDKEESEMVPSQEISTGSQRKSKLSLMDILNEILINPDPQLHKYIRSLDFLPDTPETKTANDLLSRLRSGVTFAGDICDFARRAKEMSSSVRVRSLRHLWSQLDERESELFLPESGAKRAYPKVVAAVWEILKLSHSDGSCEMKSMAACLFSTVGVWDPSAVAFCMPAPMNVCAIDEPALDLSQSGSSDSTTELFKRILVVLSGYLVDEDLLIIESALKALQGILSTEQGHFAASQLRRDESLYIQFHSRGISSKRVDEALSQAQKYEEKLGSAYASWPAEVDDCGVWVSRVVYFLLQYCNQPALKICGLLVLQKSELAELILPHVLGNISSQYSAESEVATTLATKITDHVLRASSSNSKASQVVLDALNELRKCHLAAKSLPSSTKSGKRDSPATQRDVPGPSSWKKVYFFPIDYLEVALAAKNCGALFTAVLYTELWCEETFGSPTLGSPNFSDTDSVPVHEQILLDVYSTINEPDAIYGVARTNQILSRLAVHKHEGHWELALQTYDLLCRLQPSAEEGRLQTGAGVNFHIGAVQALQKMGCLDSVDNYWRGLTGGGFQKLGRSLPEKGAQYHAAWRTGKWTYLDTVQSQGSDSRVEFNESLVQCLRSVSEKDWTTLDEEVKKAREEIVSWVAVSTRETMHCVNPAIVHLQVLDALQLSAKLLTGNGSNASQFHGESQSLQSIGLQDFHEIEKFVEEKQSCLQGEFGLMEPLIAVERSLVRILQRPDRLPRHLWRTARLARKAGKVSLGINAIYEQNQVCKTLLVSSQDHSDGFICDSHRGQVEEAKLLWAQNQQDMAVKLVQHILTGGKQSKRDAAYLLSLAGKWLAETRAISSQVILKEYLEKSADSMKGLEENGVGMEGSVLTTKDVANQKCSVYFRLAHYSDSLYRSHVARMNSAEWAAAQSVQQHKLKELDAIRKRLTSSRADDERRALEMRASELFKQLKLDNEENERVEREKDSFLLKALEGYRSTLLHGDKYNSRVVFRLIALWFDQNSVENVNESLLQTAKQVPSHKFLPLVRQLASRMGAMTTMAGTNFQAVLAFLVRKLANEHPYHSLYQLLSLAYGDRVPDKKSFKSSFFTDQDKKEAAVQVLSSLDAKHTERLSQVKQMIEMYIKLAELDAFKTASGQKGGKIRVSPQVPREVRSVRKLEMVPIVTANLPVDPTCEYAVGSFPHFCGFSDKITVMNGINAPKVVECLGSNGTLYKQLAKSGNDDLRQDAVMEQLFGLVNTLLKDHPETRKRKLQVRTYNVIPFTPSAGVLEWVQGTIPLGDYLLGPNKDGGAHLRYGSRAEWTYAKCREFITKERDKPAAFETICKNFKPVMRHFVLEKFPQPSEWFERRLAYTRSVAVCSMVGYIVGLGDRHSMNILMDTKTAEAVHIDLGIAFEQGLMLKTPERVPFRLTRDVVDGMGVCGTEGVFRRCCEASLSVLKANKEALLTIIMVFLHDPLYKWSLSPLKASRRQDESNGVSTEESLQSQSDRIEGNQDAARALLRVKQKLDGYEDGDLRSLQGQVQQLIQNAQDPDRLSAMFPGWAAWL